MAYSASIPYGGLSFGYAKQVNAGSSPRTSPNWQDDAITQTAKTDHAITFLNTLEDGVTYWIYLTPSGNPVASDQFLQVVEPPSALIQAIDNNVVSLLQMQVGNGTAIEAFTTAGGTRLVVAIQGSVTGSVNGFTITASGGAVTVLDFELKKISTQEITAVILRLSRTIAASERVHVGYTSNPGSGGGNLSVDASFVPSFSNLLVRTEAGIDALLQPIKAKTDIIGTQSEITVTTPVIPTKWRVFAFSRITNDPVLGDAANITAKLAIDHAGPAALDDLHPVEIEDGYYYFDLSTAEQTGAVFELFPESSTAGVQVIGVPGRMESNATLRAIEDKTALIGTGQATITQPVLTDGTIRTLLVIGDDYRLDDDRAFVWTVTTDVTPVSCFLGFYKDENNQVIITGSVVDNGDTVTLTFELLKADTENLEPGEYEYTVEMRDSDGFKITSIHSLNSNSKRYARFVERRT
jgi:hypothetical protein